jgi:hypothetical protein
VIKVSIEQNKKGITNAKLTNVLEDCPIENSPVENVVLFK